MVRKYSRKNYKDGKESPFNKGAGARSATGGSLKDQKGITLIALVITIIIMLILVAVTISMAVNGGLFEYAGKATGDTKNAINEEQRLANGEIQIDGKWYASIDDYINNVTVEEPKITATEVSNDLTTYLGQTVNYGVTYTDASTYGEGKWEILYADGEHIYIITKGHLAGAPLSITGYNGTSDFTAENLQSKYLAVSQGLFDKTYNPDAAGTDVDPYLKYTSSYDNMKATQYLLDSTVWEDYAPETNEFADWAIGGPTFELFVKSYNAYYPDSSVTLDTPTGYGYANPLSTSNSVPSGTYLNHSTSTYYWLACPSSYSNNYVRSVGGYDANVYYFSRYSSYFAFRPVVCLKSNVKITWNETTSQYDLALVTEK